MSVRRLDINQPDDFSFSKENERWASDQIKKYPKDKQASAVIPLLWRAQEQADGWLPEPAIRYVADLLAMPQIRVLEIATFYTMFNLSPVGRHFVQLCGTTPCWLRGAEDLKEVCRRVIGEPGQVREDGQLSWIEVECLGACVNAPMVQINADYYEDLTPESLEALLEDLAEGREVATGPQVDRVNACPMGGPTTLLNGGVQRQTRSTRSRAPARAKPKTLRKARKGGPDRLIDISGIGPKIENQLYELGIFHFDQVAAWTKADVAWIDEQLRFKGRIEREGWIAQAKALAKNAGGAS
jgi:NADH-quinone oxidoreductase subunit E